MKLPIYMDCHATTPVDPGVLEAMLPFLREHFGNAASRTHSFGWVAEEAVDRARVQVAELLGGEAREVVFTCGATESIFLGLCGAARARREHGAHVITTAIEHKAVLGSCAWLETQGFEVTTVGVDRRGIVDPDEIRAALRPDTVLVAVMAANNEIGTLQPLAEIGALCRARGAVFHSDAAQAAGKVSLDVGEIGCGLMSLSAHKLYGPAGIGALFIAPGVTLAPLLHGGAQERGLRPGTVPVALAVGFAAAAEVARREMAREAQRLTAYCDRFLRRLRRARPDLKVNGTLEARLPGYLNLRFPGIQAEDLLATVPELMLATGAACASGGAGPSPVLRALGLSAEEVAESIRISLGRFTTEAELDVVLERLTAAIARLESA